MRILVADDSRVARQIVIRTLRQAGFAHAEVIEAGTGRELLEAVRAQDPDLVLADWHMPEVSGIDALAMLRAGGSRVAFGFVTCDGSDETRARARAEGAQFLILKPFTAETFAEQLEPVATGAPPPPAALATPCPSAVRALLTGLLDKPVTVAPTAPLAPGPANPCTVAVYVDDSLRIRAVIGCDLPLSVHAGAAIGLLPPATAHASVESGALTEQLAENLGEVLNVAGSLFDAPGAPHLRLHDVHPAGVPTPPHLLAHCLTLGSREDLTVQIAGYGTGALSVVLTA